MLVPWRVPTPNETHKNKNLEPLEMAETSHQLQCWTCFVRSQVGKSGTCQVSNAIPGRARPRFKRNGVLGSVCWGAMANQEAKLIVDSLFSIFGLRTLQITIWFGQHKEVKKANYRKLVGSCSPSFFVADNEFYLCDVLFQWFPSRSDVFDAVSWTCDLV